jgi:hypothetical protein
MSIDVIASWAQVISVVAPVFVGIYAVWRRIDKRQVEAYIETMRVRDQLAAVQKQLDVQFGGNGGGIREAINTMKSDQKVMDSKLDKACADIANLQGKFDQHIVEQP